MVWVVLLLGLLGGDVDSAPGQELINGMLAARHPLRPANTSSPRDTMRSFRDECDAMYRLVSTHGRNSETWAEYRYLRRRILDCLDLEDQPAYLTDVRGLESAALLKETLDRISLPRDSAIPGPEDIRDESDEWTMQYWRVPNTDIIIHRITEGPRTGEWVFAPRTVNQARSYFNRVAHLPYQLAGTTPGFHNLLMSEPGSQWLSRLVRRLPAWAHVRVYGQAIWQWIGLVLSAILSVMVMIISYKLARIKTGKRRWVEKIRYTLSLAFPIIAMLVPLAFRNFIADMLFITGEALVIGKFTANVVFLIAAIIVVFGAGNRLAELIIRGPKFSVRGLDAQLVRLVCRATAMILAMIIFLEGGQYLGVPLTTLLAGAGVGGLAVALAAQDALKNFFGSLMIILDRPYKVGERIITKQYDGFVEEIGLRSTKIRLLTGHLATIPNEEMARTDIENVGRRPHIRRIINLSVPLGTSADTIERAIAILHELLDNHPGFDPVFPPRIYFDELNRDSLHIIVIYWFHPPDWWAHMDFAQELNLGIKRRFAEEGIEFALPASQMVVSRQAAPTDPPFPPEKETEPPPPDEPR